SLALIRAAAVRAGTRTVRPAAGLMFRSGGLRNRPCHSRAFREQAVVRDKLRLRPPMSEPGFGCADNLRAARQTPRDLEHARSGQFGPPLGAEKGQLGLAEAQKVF